MKKKKNPKKQPVTMADLTKAKRETKDEAVRFCWAILFNVLRDKEGFDREALRRVWNEVNDLSDSVSRGFVSLPELMSILKNEAGIILEEENGTT